jgi:hypothetical protein
MPSCELAQSTHLVRNVVRKLLGSCTYLSSPKALQVIVSWMSADTDPMFHCQTDGFCHEIGIASVKTCGDICRSYLLHQRTIITIAYAPMAKCLTQITVDVY